MGRYNRITAGHAREKESKKMREGRRMLEGRRGRMSARSRKNGEHDKRGQAEFSNLNNISRDAAASRSRLETSWARVSPLPLAETEFLRR